LLCEMSVRIAWRGSGFDGIGQTCGLVFDVVPSRCRTLRIMWSCLSRRAAVTSR
jgi:hypothetical protein